MALTWCTKVDSTEYCLAGWCCNSALWYKSVWEAFLHTIFSKEASGLLCMSRKGGQAFDSLFMVNCMLLRWLRKFFSSSRLWNQITMCQPHNGTNTWACRLLCWMLPPQSLVRRNWPWQVTVMSPKQLHLSVHRTGCWNRKRRRWGHDVTAWCCLHLIAGSEDARNPQLAP